MSLIKSVQHTDRDILLHIRNLYLKGKNFDLDPCYCLGKIYGNLERPKLCMDKTPRLEGTVKNDLLNGLPLKDRSVRGIVFDPPFLFDKRTNDRYLNNVISKRYTMFKSLADLKLMHQTALEAFYRVLKHNGILAYKCQDYTNHRTFLLHCMAYQWAVDVGFKSKDLFILVPKHGVRYNKRLKQRHSRKVHSYWYVFQK